MSIRDQTLRAIELLIKATPPSLWHTLRTMGNLHRSVANYDDDGPERALCERIIEAYGPHYLDLRDRSFMAGFKLNDLVLLESACWACDIDPQALEHVFPRKRENRLLSSEEFESHDERR